MTTFYLYGTWLTLFPPQYLQLATPQHLETLNIRNLPKTRDDGYDRNDAPVAQIHKILVVQWRENFSSTTSGKGQGKM